MGCGKICKAKKKAKKAKKQAEEMKNKPIPKGPVIPGVPTPSTNVEIVTVADLIGFKNRAGSVSPSEMLSKLSVAKRNSMIRSNSVANGLISPLKSALGTYKTLKKMQYGFTLAKPAVKMIMNIGGVIFNFANIAELLGDVALLIIGITVGLAPIFLRMLQQIFLSIPLDIGIMTSYQLNQTKNLVEMSKIKMKNSFNQCVKNLSTTSVIEENNKNSLNKAILGNNAITEVNGVKFDSVGDRIETTFKDFSNDINNNIPIDREKLKEELTKGFEKNLTSCKDIVSKNLNNELKKQKVSILLIDGVANFDSENKNKVKTTVNGLHDATKKIEMLQASEMLKRQFSVSGAVPNAEGEVFDDNDLAVAAVDIMLNKLDETISDDRDISIDDIFKEVLNKEIEKKKNILLKDRETLVSLDVANDIVESNKINFVNNIKYNLSIIDTMPEVIVITEEKIPFCPENIINSEFEQLKEIILLQQTQFINQANINNTNDMLELKNSIVLSIEQTITDFIPVVSPECQIAFKKDICSILKEFKVILFRTTKLSIEKANISIENLPVRSDISKFELKKMTNTILAEIKKKLVIQAKDLIINEIAPCKSCRPCEDFLSDLNIKASTFVDTFKSNMNKNIESQIINKQNDYSINSQEDILIKKELLISELNIALSRNSGILAFRDEILFKLKAEEKELLKNVSLSLNAL